MRGPRTRFVSRSRERGQSEADRRRAWAAFIDTARDHARRAAGGRPVSDEETQGLRAQIVRLSGPAFPVTYASATAAAEATLIVARAFAGAGRPEDRAMLGEYLLAGAFCLDNLLAQAAIAAAAEWRRRMGEAD